MTKRPVNFRAAKYNIINVKIKGHWAIESNRDGTWRPIIVGFTESEAKDKIEKLKAKTKKRTSKG